jgi:hypothetical protein
VEKLRGKSLARWYCTFLLAVTGLLVGGCGSGSRATAAPSHPAEAESAGEETVSGSAPSPPGRHRMQTTAPAESGPKDENSGSYGYEFANDPLFASDDRLAQASPSPAGPAAAGPNPIADAPSQDTPANPTLEVQPAASGPLLIYTATVHIAVFETQKALAAAEQLAKTSKGYLVRRADQSITFRVPAEKFQTVFDAVLELGDVLHRQVEARDVTEEFYDVQTRTRTLEAMRDRLEQLLQQAKNVKEALAVERELGRVVEAIERSKGRLKLLRELIAFSTITIEFQPRQVESIESSVKLPFPWLNRLGLGHLLAL